MHNYNEMLKVQGIRETQRINEVNNTKLRHGVLTPEDSDGITFYLRGDFWASSIEPDIKEIKDAPDLKVLSNWIAEKYYPDHNT